MQTLGNHIFLSKLNFTLNDLWDQLDATIMIY